MYKYLSHLLCKFINCGNIPIFNKSFYKLFVLFYSYSFDLNNINEHEAERTASCVYRPSYSAWGWIPAEDKMLSSVSSQPAWV